MRVYTMGAPWSVCAAGTWQRCQSAEAGRAGAHGARARALTGPGARGVKAEACAVSCVWTSLLSVTREAGIDRIVCAALR